MSVTELEKQLMNGGVKELPNLDLTAEEIKKIKESERHNLVVQFHTLKLRVKINQALGQDEFVERCQKEVEMILKAIDCLDNLKS